MAGQPGEALADVSSPITRHLEERLLMAEARQAVRVGHDRAREVMAPG
jgi:hypothetical protein